jgi:hypothetical protein
LINVLLALGATFLVLHIAELWRPGDVRFKLLTLFVLGALPVFYKTFSQFWGQPYIAFFLTLAMLALAWLPGFAAHLRARGARLLRLYTHGAVIPAGAVLGLAGAVRVIAPAAGALVVVYFLTRAGKRSIPLALCYFFVGGTGHLCIVASLVGCAGRRLQRVAQDHC